MTGLLRVTAESNQSEVISQTSDHITDENLCANLELYQLYEIDGYTACVSSDFFGVHIITQYPTQIPSQIREAPVKKMPGLFGHCPNGGGVSTLARMVWGTYF